MIKTKKRGTLIVLSGPTAVGKGTISKELVKEDNIWLSVSATTREKRPLEVDGVHYFFMTKEEFEERIENNQFLEYAIVHNNNYYGTPKDKIEEKLELGIDVLLEIDIQGALSINNQYKDALFIFLLPPSMKILKERFLARNTEDKAKMLDRFKRAYKEINEVKKYNYVVVNDILEDAITKVKSIIIAEKCRVDRIEELDIGNIEELIHEELVDFNK